MSDRGSVTVVAASMMLVLVVMTAGLSDVVRVLVAVSDAQTAADAAALAAAQDLAVPRGVDPQSSAADIAGANGAELIVCECAPGSAEATVEVVKTVPSLLLLPGMHSVRARARAVVGSGR